MPPLPSLVRAVSQMYLGTLALPLHNADRVDLISALAFVVSQLPAAQVPPPLPLTLPSGLQVFRWPPRPI